MFKKSHATSLALIALGAILFGFVTTMTKSCGDKSLETEVTK